MPKIKTDDLIQYLYHETSKDQNLAIEKALQTDWELKDELNILKDSLTRLDRMIKSPRDQSVQAILNYAKSTSIMEV